MFIQNPWQIAFDPVNQAFDMAGYFSSHRGEAVLNVGWHDRIGFAQDETIEFQKLEGLRKHLFADASNLATQIAEAMRTREQGHQY
ncbi:hypothetical protein BB029_13745 [Pseudomonas sp. S3E12]|nr:hypothetical protein BB029_13745 [Pseudomonas sp. S3E12]